MASHERCQRAAPEVIPPHYLRTQGATGGCFSRVDGCRQPPRFEQHRADHAIFPAGIVITVVSARRGGLARAGLLDFVRIARPEPAGISIARIAVAVAGVGEPNVNARVEPDLKRAARAHAVAVARIGEVFGRVTWRKRAFKRADGEIRRRLRVGVNHVGELRTRQHRAHRPHSRQRAGECQAPRKIIRVVGCGRIRVLCSGVGFLLGDACALVGVVILTGPTREYRRGRLAADAGPRRRVELEQARPGPLGELGPARQRARKPLVPEPLRRVEK